MSLPSQLAINSKQIAIDYRPIFGNDAVSNSQLPFANLWLIAKCLSPNANRGVS